MSLKRVVVTGLGSLTPIGNDINSFWKGLVSGKSGADYITYFDSGKFKTQFACELKGYDPLNYFERKEARKLDRFAQYAIVCSDEAIKDSKLQLDKIDKSKSIYIVEGPFDSTFVENAVAMCGSDVDIGSFDWSDYIWVLDNEPRNREIVTRISKLIDRGHKVVIWPSNIIEKDINDMVLAGHDVMSMLKLNTYSGLEAKIKFNSWKKV